MNDQPPLHSEQSSRTRPARWRRPLPRPLDLARIRRNLGRATLTLGVLIALLSLGGSVLVRTRSGSAPASAPATVPAGAVVVGVARIIDGDTLDVRAAETVLRVRLYGVDAPEIGDRCAAEATQRLTALAGTSVRLIPDARPTDRFGRELRYVYTADGQSIDAALVRDGYAHAWREDGSQRDALEAQAQAALRGCLWAGR